MIESSAINQQIATKTIKKFGFSVTAVWNGKEALDYLVEKLTSSHPKPDIILMDVQMPILDGYRATHLIRHHNPYASLPGMHSIPIVAMTASAIQGDKEKCKKAGMDDYLAKPVQGKTLENMLVKWSLERKRKKTRNEVYNLKNNDHDSDCTDEDPTSVACTIKTPRSSTPSEKGDQARIAADESRMPGPESEGERGLQRVAAAEKASSLRDEKFFAAGKTGIEDAMSPHAMPTKPPRLNSSETMLTEENMDKLHHEQEEAQPYPVKQRRESVDEENSNLATGNRGSMVMNVGETSPSKSKSSSLGSLTGQRFTQVRSRLSRNESDITVTPKTGV